MQNTFPENQVDCGANLEVSNVFLFLVKTYHVKALNTYNLALYSEHFYLKFVVSKKVFDLIPKLEIENQQN